MRTSIFIIFCSCFMNIEAKAVVLYIAQADDAKRAEEILTSKAKANKEFLVKSRIKLKDRHAARKVNTGPVVAASDEGGENKSKPLLPDGSVSEGDSRGKEIKEVDRPQQSSQ